MPEDIAINGYPLFHVVGVLPGSLAALSTEMAVILRMLALYPSREVIANYWRLVETHRATVLSAVPAALANVLLDGADISALRH